MKVWISIISFIVLLLFGGTGCGGGTSGGTADGTTDGTTGGIVRADIEATENGAIIDPTNIVAGEVVQFVVAGYTSDNTRSILPSSGWSVDGNGASEGSITGSGLYTASAAGPLFNVSATAASQVVSGRAQVKATGQAIVTGRVTNGFGAFPAGIVVDFYDSSNTLVGSSNAQSNGTFRAVVPASATTFEIRKSSIPAGYYKEYAFASKWYLPQGACRAPLPTLTNGVTTVLAGDIQIPPTTSNGAGLPPPPPPSACS